MTAPDDPFFPVPVAFNNQLTTSILSEVQPPADIHVMALTPKLLQADRQGERLLSHLEGGSRLRLLLTGGLSALTWNISASGHLESVAEFREKAKDRNCDHRMEVRERDWAPSVGLLHVAGSNEDIMLVSVYTPSRTVSSAQKPVMRLSHSEQPDLMKSYADQFLALWREAAPVAGDADTRLRQLREAADVRFQEILRAVYQVHVAFVVALREEMEVLLSLVGEYESNRDPATGQFIYRFSVHGRSCLAVLVGAMGHTTSAQLVERLARLHAIQTVVSVGIAGGTNSDVSVGDVVVASQVNSYLENAKASADEADDTTYVLTLGGQATRTTHRYCDAALNYEFAYTDGWAAWRSTCEKAAGQYLKRAPTGQPESTEGAALYTSLAQGAEDCTAAELAARHPRINLEPSIHANDAHIASGPVVGAHTAFVKWLKASSDRKALALEMEAGGVVMAAHWRASPLQSLVVRGVSDLADDEKGGLEDVFGTTLRQAAMHNATTLVFALIGEGLVD